MFRWAQERGPVVVSYDEDFADTRSFPLGTHHGIVRLRVWPTPWRKPGWQLNVS